MTRLPLHDAEDDASVTLLCSSHVGQGSPPSTAASRSSVIVPKVPPDAGGFDLVGVGVVVSVAAAKLLLPAQELNNPARSMAAAKTAGLLIYTDPS